MKNLILIISIFALIGCAKEQQPEPVQLKTHQFTLKSDKLESGIYPGYRWIDIPCAFTVDGSCTQTLTVDGDSLTVKWCNETAPVKCLLSDTINYTITYDYTSDGCGNQRTVINYTMTGTFRNDSLIQTGQINYRYFYNGKLTKQCSGDVKLVCGTNHL